MIIEAVFQGPGAGNFNQYLLEIILIIFGAFLLGYLFRHFLNDKLKRKVTSLEQELSEQQKSEHMNNVHQEEISQLKADLENSREAYSRAVSEKLSLQTQLEDVKSNPSKEDDIKEPMASSSSESTKDDLTIIEGVGPKIQSLLNEGGVHSYDQIIQMNPQAIRDILIKSGPTYAVHDPTTWAEQSVLAKNGEIEKLKMLQKELKGGKRKS
ncbi:MAG: hypothetical protein JXR19_11480 [Bacteroidia bacterium]